MSNTLKAMMAHANNETKKPTVNKEKTQSKVRDHMVHLRLNDFEKEGLDKVAEKLGTTKATALRMGLIDYLRKHGVL